MKKEKSCNHCGTKENLMVDKLGRIHSICNSCRSTVSDKGRNTQKVKQATPRISDKYFTFTKVGSLINISNIFFIDFYINKDRSLLQLSKDFNISERSLRKYLLLYNLEEKIRCRYCNTDKNLLFMEGRTCQCCKSCWNDTYKNRNYFIKPKTNKVRKIYTSSGIGIKAQFLFLKIEDELNKRDIIYDFLQYGFYDLKLNKRVKSEKQVIPKNKGKHNNRRLNLDFYLEIDGRFYVIEFDEYRHSEYKNYIKDIEREKEIVEVHSEYQFIRIPEGILKECGPTYIIEEIIKIITKQDYNNLFQSKLDEIYMFEQQDISYQNHLNEIYDNQGVL